MNLPFFTVRFICFMHSTFSCFSMELNVLTSKLRSSLVWVNSQFSWLISCLASMILLGDILSSRLLLFSRGMCPSSFTYSSWPIFMFSFDFLISSLMYWNLRTSSDFILKRVWILLITLFSKVSDPAKQKPSTCVVIMLWSWFLKYYGKIAWSYFEGVAPNFISSSLSVRYHDQETSVKRYTHLDDFQM